MIPDSVVMAAGWLFIWSLGIGFTLGVLIVIWDKVSNRIDRMRLRGESTARLKTIVRNIDEELKSRGDK